MAVLGRLDMGSGERLDLTDFLSIDSYTAGDFKYLIQSLVGSTTPYILTGFEVIAPQTSIGTTSISIDIGNSVVYYPSSLAGSFYYGLPEGSPNALPLVPQLRQGTSNNPVTNFVYLTFNTINTANDSRAFWDVGASGGTGGEFSQNINTETALVVDVNVSTSTFPPNTIPVCIVVMGTTITSIEDCRDMMFRLGTGGVSPNPFNSFQFPQRPSAPYARLEPSSTMTNSGSPNPFEGGDKNINTLKQWMDAVMTRIKELGGTTYWYEGGSALPNTNDIFNDALASTLVSKGTWTHSASIPGRATWSEDMIYVSLNSERNIYIRGPATIDIPNDYVAWIDLVRDVQINNSTTAVTWQNGNAYVSGVVGSFSNLAQGDLVKQAGNNDTYYLMVEQFYLGTNGSGGTTGTPSLAQSILLNGAYQGTSGIQIGTYTQGVYNYPANVNITPRSDPSIQAAGGNFYWLAYRSDTALSLASIATTTLSLNIATGNGQQAVVTATGTTGLTNGDRVIITTGPYANAPVVPSNPTSYQVEVLDATHFSIQTTVTAVDSSLETAYYATVTTAARTIPLTGFVLESADHGFTSGDIATFTGAGSLPNGSYQVNTTGATTFTIPVSSAITVGALAGEIVVLARMNVRTEFGTVKIVQGETVNIGDDPQNLLDYIGMTSLAETQPAYLLPVGYNALAGYQNYNSSVTDNLTLRVAQLTAMMADRVQDRGMQIIGRTNITSVTSGSNQMISALANLTLVSPSSADQVITLTTPIALPANSAIVITTNRNGSGTALTPTVVSLGNQLLLQENNLILFYRFGTTKVHDWHGYDIQPNGHLNTEYPEDSQNRNVAVFNPGDVKLTLPSGLLNLNVQRAPQQTQITTLAAASVPQSSYFNFSDALDVHKYYVWYDKDGGGADPLIVGRTGIQVNITTGQTATTVAAATVTAVNTAAGTHVTATNTAALITIVNLLNGTTTNAVDGVAATTFQITVIQEGFAPDIEILIPGSQPNYITVDAINGLGTLILADGSSVWCRIDRFNTKVFNEVAFADSTDTDANGILYVTTTVTVPIDQDVIVLWSRVGDNILVTNEIQHPEGNVYEEFLDVGVFTPSGSVLQLPLDSRNGGAVRSYVVGSGQLEMFLNGQYLRNGVDWMELGSPGALSSRIEILQNLVIGDVLYFRVDTSGAVYFAASSGGGGSLQASYTAGRFIATNFGQPVTITGTPGDKLLWVEGDVQIDGVIDPAGITFSQQSTNPFDGVTQYGLYRDASDDLIYARGALASLNLSTAFLYANGSNQMLAPLNMGTQQIINLVDPTTAQMAATKHYVDTNFLLLSGANPMAGTLNMNSHYISNLLDPVNPQDSATKAYVDSLNNHSSLFSTYTNNTGSTMLAGDIVVMSLTTPGDIVEANNTTLATSQGIVGVLYQTLVNGASGYVQTAGIATVNPGGFTTGIPVYISSTNGRGTSTVPTGTGIAVVSIGTAVSATQVQLDMAFEAVNNNVYNEFITVVSGAPANGYQITGPVTISTVITLPPDSRNGGAARSYIVGQGLLNIYLNGQFLIDGQDWSEIGTTGSTSTTIMIDQALVIGDKLSFDIDIAGETFLAGGGGGGSVNNAVNVGSGSQIFTSLVGTNLEFRSLIAGSGISLAQNTNDITITAVGSPAQTVTTQTSNYTALSSDNVILVDATSGNIVITLPAASGLSGHLYEIKKIDSSAHTVTITPNGSDKIDNASTLVISTQYASFTIVAASSEWWIL